MGKDDAALAAFERAEMLSPGYLNCSYFKGRVLLGLDRCSDALEELQREPLEARRLMGEVAAYHALDQSSRSDERVAEFESITEGDGWEFYAAELHAYRGEHDDAFRLLDIALESRHPSLGNLLFSRWLEPLHGDRRWPEFVQRVAIARRSKLPSA